MGQQETRDVQALFGRGVNDETQHGPSDAWERNILVPHLSHRSKMARSVLRHARGGAGAVAMVPSLSSQIS